MLFMLMIFAQLERETIAERGRDNYYQRSKLGRWMGSPAPYGTNIGRLEGKILTFASKENIMVVHRIFRTYLFPNNSLEYLAKDLNEHGVPTPKGKTWTSQAIARIIRNPAYAQADIKVYNFFKSLVVEIDSDIERFGGIFGGILVGKRGASTRKRIGFENANFFSW